MLSITVAWPLGPHVPPLAEQGRSRAWVDYKLRSAAWYIDTLERLGGEVGLDRLTGVEMALDGALTALCGAVDAAERILIWTVAEGDGRRLTKPGATANRLRLDPPLAERCGPVGRAGAELKVAHEVGGWLKTLRALRNQAVVVAGGELPAR